MTQDGLEIAVMGNLNAIGLDSAKAHDLAEKLNDLVGKLLHFLPKCKRLSLEYQRRKRFLNYSVKFEELYNDLIIKIDDIAERILTLGKAPNHKYSDYIMSSEIKESNEGSDGKKAISLKYWRLSKF